MTTDEDFTDITDLFDSPEAAAAAAQRAQGGTSASSPPPTLVAPSDGPVSLPGGFRRYHDASTIEDVRTAVVRELTGADEEEISKARLKSNPSAWYMAILKAGIVKLGEEEPKPGELLDLPIGDTDYLLLEISRATFGDELEFESLVCHKCGAEFSVTISKSEDIEIARWDSVDDMYFDVPLRNGRVAKVRAVTGREQPFIDKAETPAETNTAVLSRCVETIEAEGEEPLIVSDDPSIVRDLSVRDRQAILTEIAKRSPGPRYTDVKFKHEPGCGAEIGLSVGLMELFRGL